MVFESTLMTLLIVKLVLFPALVIIFFYNLLTTKNKQWGTFGVIIFSVFMLEIFEGEVYEDQMYEQYEDIYGQEYKDTTVSDYCISNRYDCSDFSDRADAQLIFEACGGINNDVHHFDGDGDGIACEWN